MIKKATRLLRQLWQPGGTLSERVLHAGGWTAALRLGRRGLSLVRVTILARLLSPDAFGLFGMVLLTLATIRTFTKTGFNEALIQDPDDRPEDLDTIWVVHLLRGLAIGGIVFAAAPLVARFFEEPGVVPLLRAVAAAVVLKGAANPGATLLQKHLNLQKDFVWQLGSGLLNTGVALLVAALYGSVWALVAGYLAGAVAKTALSYWVHPYRPSLAFRRESFERLFSFGKWLLGSSVLVFLLNQGDDLFVGKVVGASALGLYQMAYRVSNLPTTEIQKVIARVTFPAYAKIQEDLATLRRAYLDVIRTIAVLSFPLGTLIAVQAELLTGVVFGDQWLPMVPALQILCLWGVIRSIGATTGPVLMARGRPDVLTKVQAFKLAVLAASIVPLTDLWGIAGTAVAVVLAAFAANPIIDWIVIQEIEASVWSFLRPLAVPTAGCLALAVTCRVGSSVLTGLGELPVLVTSSLLGGAAYVAVILFVDKWTGYKIIDTIRARFALS